MNLRLRLPEKRVRAADHDTVTCEDCRATTVHVVRSHRRTPLDFLRRQAQFSAHCLTCWCKRGYPGRVTTWWLPEPYVDGTWLRLDARIPDRPPGCVSCGGWRNPTSHAVWGLGDRTGDYELYCRSCFTDATTRQRWEAGCTWADIGPVYTVADIQRVISRGYADRRPFTGGAR